MNKFFTITLATILAITMFNCSSDDDSTNEITLTGGEWYVYKYETNGKDVTRIILNICNKKSNISFLKEKKSLTFNDVSETEESIFCTETSYNGEWKEIKSTEKGSKMYLVNLYQKIDDNSDLDREEEDTFVLKGDVLKTTFTSENVEGIKETSTIYYKKQ